MVCAPVKLKKHSHHLEGVPCPPPHSIVSFIAHMCTHMQTCSTHARSDWTADEESHVIRTSHTPVPHPPLLRVNVFHACAVCAFPDVHLHFSSCLYRSFTQGDAKLPTLVQAGLSSPSAGDVLCDFSVEWPHTGRFALQITYAMSGPPPHAHLH